jgi:hypothetical protein
MVHCVPQLYKSGKLSNAYSLDPLRLRLASYDAGEAVQTRTAIPWSYTPIWSTIHSFCGPRPRLGSSAPRIRGQKLAVDNISFRAKIRRGVDITVLQCVLYAGDQKGTQAERNCISRHRKTACQSFVFDCSQTLHESTPSTDLCIERVYILAGRDFISKVRHCTISSCCSRTKWWAPQGDTSKK